MAAKSSLAVQVYDNVETLTDFLAAWDDLLSACPSASIFSTWEWLTSWWRSFGAGQRLLAVAFRDSAGRLVGLAPLSLTSPSSPRRVLRLMGDGSGDSDNLDLLARPGFENEVAKALLDYLRDHSGAWDLCQLNRVPSESPVGESLVRHLTQRRWTAISYPQPRSLVPLPETWEAYLNQLSSKERGKIGIRTRRLEKRYRVRYVKCTEADLRTYLDVLFRLHQNRWQLRGEAGSFNFNARRQFYEEMGGLFLARQWLEFWLLELDGKVAAAQFGFRYRDTVYSLQEGFDPAYSSDSVGYVLRAHVLRDLIAAGVRRYDFLWGESPAKARWGVQMCRYVDIHFARPWTRGSMYLHAVHRAGKTKEQLRGLLPPAAWRVLQFLRAPWGPRPRPPVGDQVPASVSARL